MQTYTQAITRFIEATKRLIFANITLLGNIMIIEEAINKDDSFLSAQKENLLRLKELLTLEISDVIEEREQ